MGPWRVAAAIGLFAVGYVILVAGELLIGTGYASVAGGLAIGWLVLTVAFIAKSRRRSLGTARLVFVPGGVSVTPIKIDATKDTGEGAGFIAFRGDETAQLKVISSVWSSLTIARTDRSKVLAAGIRCPRAQVDFLLATIDELIRKRPAAIGSTPPTE